MPNRKPKWTLLVPLTSLLAGCATGAPSAPAPDVRNACPAIATYSRAFEADVADELAAPPAKPALERWSEDYVALRDAARACQH